MNIALSIKPKYWDSYTTPTVHDSSSMLSRYILKADITLDGSTTWVNRGQLWFVPALFNQLNGGYLNYGIEPEHGYFIEIPDLTSYNYGVDELSMPIKSDVSQAELTNFNRNAKVVFNTTQTATVTFEFFVCGDLREYINNIIYSPRDYILKSTVHTANELINKLPTVFNGQQELSTYCFYEHPDENEDLQYEDEELIFHSRFYDQGLFSGTSPLPAEFTGFDYEIKDINGVPTSSLDATQNYNLTVMLDAAAVPTRGYVYLVPDNEDFDNEAPFFLEMLLEEALIQTDAGTTRLGKGLYAPSTDWTLDSGKYKATFTVDPSDLETGKNYYLVLVADNGTISNSFIVPEVLNVTQVPSNFPVVPITAGWKDYHNAILTNGDTIPVVDRVQAFLNIDQLPYRQTIGALDISTGNIEDEIREVRLRLHDPFSNQVDVDYKAVYQSGQFTSTNANKFTVDFDTTQQRLTAQSILRLGFLNKQGLYNLAGFKLIADWEVDFYLEAENLIVTYTVTRELDIRDFDNTETDGIIDYIKILDPDTDVELVSLCDYAKDNVKCEVQITPPNAEDVWYLHAFTDEHPYGVRPNSENDLERQQEYTGRLPQEQSVEIFDQDIVFDVNNKAYFYLDLDQVNALKAGRIYVVVKKAPLIPINEGVSCFDELKATKGNSGNLYDGKPIMQRVSIDKQTMLDMDDVNNNFFNSQGLSPTDERPFIMLVGLGKTGSERAVKGEILKNNTVVATTGETGGNYGPFDPNDSSLVYNAAYYIKDDVDLNTFPPTRIDDFIAEWGFLPLWPYGIPYGVGNNCQETLDTWIDQFTEWLNSKCAQLVWCKYTRAELEDSSTDFDLVMWWNMKTNPLRDKALYSTCNCMLVPLCPAPQSSYLRESEVGTLYNKYRTSGAQVFLDVTLLMSMTTYSTQQLSGTSNFKTRINTGLTNTEYPFAGAGTPPLNINTSENYSNGQTDGFEAENIYQTNPDGYKWGAWIKGGDYTATPLEASTGSNKIVNIGVFNSYDSGDPMGDWVKFRYQFANSGNIDIPIDSVVVEVYKQATTSYDAEGRIQVSGGTLVYNQTVATSYTGFTPATFIDLNLEEEIRHQFVLKFIEDGVITAMALIEQDLKKEP